MQGVPETDRAGGNTIDAHVHLSVPPTARSARLLWRGSRWGVYYRSSPGDVGAHAEFRQIDRELLRLEVDPADTEAVIACVEDGFHAAGYGATRRAAEDDPVAAGWDIEHLGTA